MSSVTPTAPCARWRRRCGHREYGASCSTSRRCRLASRSIRQGSSSGSAEQLAAGDREGVVSTFLQEVVGMPALELDLVRADPSWDARVAAAYTIPRELRIADTYQPDLERAAAVRVPTLLLVGGDSPLFLVEPTRRLHELISESRLVVMSGQQHVAEHCTGAIPEARRRLPNRRLTLRGVEKAKASPAGASHLSARRCARSGSR